MEKYTNESLAEALAVVSSTIGNCERMQSKFAAGTSQHTLLRNRLKALRIAESLMKGEPGERYTSGELAAALRPIVSIIGKCEKAQLKFAAGNPYHVRFANIIGAMRIAESLIGNELARRD